MNTMKQAFSIFLVFLVTGLILTVGCQKMKGFRSKSPKKAEAPAPSASAPAERDNFPGGCLVVTLDDRPTTEVKKENNEQIWAGGDISATPTLVFAMDESVLGPLKNVSLVIQPVRDGKVVEGDIYQYAGKKKLTPGQPIRLDAFTHVKDNKLQSGVKSLPAGAYRVALQVHGRKHWDRQRIDVTVKKGKANDQHP